MSLGLSRTRNRPRVAPGYRLGDPIALEDLLALPRDGERYGRDTAGRLTIMSPESASRHKRPIARLLCWLNRELPAAFEAVQEPSLAFPRIWALKGQRLLPESRIGRKAIEPDIAVFSRRPDVVQGNPEPEPMRWDLFQPGALRLVVELVSPATWRQDLGLGRADRVDRWRTYLQNGVPEYWVLNAAFPGVALPSRSGLFLRNAGERWEPLPGEGLSTSTDEVQDLHPVLGGRITSPALGLTLDLGRFWADAC